LKIETAWKATRVPSVMFFGAFNVLIL